MEEYIEELLLLNTDEYEDDEDYLSDAEEH